MIDKQQIIEHSYKLVFIWSLRWAVMAFYVSATGQAQAFQYLPFIATWILMLVLVGLTHAANQKLGLVALPNRGIANE